MEENADQPNLLARSYNKLTRWLATPRLLFPGAWLFTLFLVFGLIVVFSLSAHQLQYTIKSAAKADGSSVGLWEVLRDHEEWRSLKRASASKTEQLSLNSKNLLKLETHIVALKHDNDAMESKCIAAIEALRRYLAKERILPLENWSKPGRCNFESLNEGKGQVQDIITKLDDSDPPEFHTRVENISDAISQSDQGINLLRRTEERQSALVKANEELQIQRSDHKEKINNLLADRKLGVETGDFLNALTYLEANQALPLIPNFTEMPPDMLTLILVMAMGVLGATINLTRGYLNQKNGSGPRSSSAVYLFRPILGAITALAIFILAKAGVLIISNPASNGTGALSPFFVSFLGIISGLMADQALDTIQRRGSSWFGNAGSAEQERWAFGLPNALQALNKESGEIELEKARLADTVGVSPATLSSWINEERPVPYREQEIIAAYFRIPARELFSDRQIVRSNAG